MFIWACVCVCSASWLCTFLCRRSYIANKSCSVMRNALCICSRTVFILCFNVIPDPTERLTPVDFPSLCNSGSEVKWSPACANISQISSGCGQSCSKARGPKIYRLSGKPWLSGRFLFCQYGSRLGFFVICQVFFLSIPFLVALYFSRLLSAVSPPGQLSAVSCSVT